MPVLARKIIICAAVDGLILQPTHGSRDQRPIPPVRVRYGDGSISSVSRDGVPDISQPNSSFEAHGVVGLLTVFRYNYLVSITRRQQVAQIRGVPVYVVTEVALTPCSSQKDAGEAVASTALSLGKADADKTPDVDAATEADHDDTRSETGTIDSVVDYAPEPSGAADWPAALSQNSSRSSIAEDVIGRRGSYGRFAQRWFSKSGWALGQKRSMGLSPEKALADSGGDAGPANTAIPDGARITEDAAGSDAARNLLPKFLRTTQILFGSSRSFYFSYDHDLTRSLKNPQTPDTPLFPMHNHVDPEYFWNRNILQPFIDAGIDSLALPLMQGFVGQRTFVVDRHPPQEDDGPGKDSVEMADFARRASGAGSPPDQGTPDPGASEKRFNITVVSRRSTQRAGLRYLRRGVDDAGYAANNVETEQMLSPADATRDPAARVYSFTQVRGSIPLFFTQSPFSLKPAPVVQHSAEANFAAMSKHFERLRRRYGGLQVVNLVEKHGTEAQIGEQFEKNVDRINKAAQWEDDLVPFEWFDFHAACRGMKFENVSLLLQTLGSRLDGFGSTVVVHDKLAAQQSGVFRTNCMDCLDRTNVCQSSFAKFMLDAQLKEQGFEMGAQADQVNAWFNTLWADNGDAISRQYASTNAMKGDYTRTKKRDYRGALTDAGLSLTRLFNGMFNDYFLQATIDFLLGNVTSLVFEEFEDNMMTKDPAVSMQKVREQAIEMCRSRLVADDSEEFTGGWTLLTPVVANTVKGHPFEEAVLLLTDSAVYLCRIDWSLDKVSSFERVELSHVQSIKFGAYITSTLTPAQSDEVRNVGLVIDYTPSDTDETRVNTRSLSTNSDAFDETVGGEARQPSGIGGVVGRRRALHVATAGPARKRLALKALQSQSSIADPSVRAQGGSNGAAGTTSTRLTEIQQVVLITSEIERLTVKSQPELAGKKPGEVRLVEEGDIVSLAEAKRDTGVLQQLGHSLKKLVWA